MTSDEAAHDREWTQKEPRRSGRTEVFVNELGNRITLDVVRDERGVTYVMSGPSSTVENTLTAMEATRLGVRLAPLRVNVAGVVWGLIVSVQGVLVLGWQTSPPWLGVGAALLWYGACTAARNGLGGSAMRRGGPDG